MLNTVDKMRESRFWRALFALMIVIGLCAPSLLAPARAYAASTAYLTNSGSSASYGGYSTTKCYVDGVPAYCAQPSKATPSSGTYTTSKITPLVSATGFQHDWHSVCAVLYYGYGGPGFDASMWPSTWYDGSAWTADRYFAITHIIVSDYYASDAASALAGCNSSFKNWVYGTILSYNGNGGYNENSLQQKMSNTSGVPSWFYNLCFQVNTSSGAQTMVSYEKLGWISVQKESTNTELTEGNDCYSLEGAEFGIYKSESDANANKNAVGKIVTKENGYGSSDWLELGTYYVKETKAPNGYALDEEIHQVQVKDVAKATVLTVEEEPQYDPVNIMLGKFDDDRTYNGEVNIAQAGAPSLEGAEFTVRFYPTLDADYESVEPLRTWVLKTDADGFIFMKSNNIGDYQVAGDSFFHDSAGNIAYPVGTYVFQETKAPNGYVVDDSVFTRIVKGDGTTNPAVSTYNTPLIPNKIIKGGISIEKRDLDTNELTPQGGASLDGTTFEVTNENDKGAIVDGIEYAPGEVCKTLTIKDGVAETSDQTLPYGDYSIREVATGKGYSLTDGEPRYFTISEDKQMIHYSDTAANAEDGAFKNAVKRGDIEFIKKSDVNGHTMAGIPFKITSKTTGESHIVVTDENGEANTSSAWNKHSQNTNGNDDGNYNAENGIWFGTAPVDDNRGALPYDTYTIEELPCDANKGYTMISDEFTITRDNYVFDYGTVTNQVPSSKWITTHATDAIDSDKLIVADPEAVINDHVAYGGLEAGMDYTLSATLIDKATGEVIPGASAQVSFTAPSERGSVEVQIPVNLVDYAGKDVVVYEVLSQGGQTIVEHQDADDSEQTVHVTVPSVGTTATDDADGDHKIVNDTEAVIRDLVAYDNLVPGKEYTAVGTLMVKSVDENGNVTADALLDKDGNPITTTVNFTPKGASGTIDVVFVFDASMLDSDTELVVFEKLLRGDIEVATHEDPADSNQTVTIIEPEIGTTAVDGVDGDKNVVSDANVRIIDTITYSNLVVGKEYTASGKLMEKVAGENGEITEAELLDKDGNAITASVKFTPQTPNGSVEVEFVFDGYELESGTQIVAFEEVYDADKLVAVHADINDEAQTVEVINPRIGTSAYDSYDMDGIVIADKDAKIIDSVTYDNLAIGTEYTAYGLLMDKATGLPLLTGEHASEITDGELVSFVHGLATLLGISDDELSAICDASATANDPALKDLVGEFADALDVHNPLAGFTDRIVSDNAVSKVALAEYFAEHADIVSALNYQTKTFKPTNADGSIEMLFNVNTEGLEGKDVVVYELLLANDLIAASHVDITDEGQTVEIVPTTIGTTATDKTDGDHYLLPSTEATSVDTVNYENVVPGKEYVLKGVVMDKATGKQLVVDDKPVSAEMKFTANNTEGLVDIEFTFDASKLSDGAELVVFEELYKDDVLVAEHKDIDDEAQTVTIGNPPANPDGGIFDKTGADLLPWTVLAALLIAAACTAGIYGVRKHKAQPENTSENEEVQA